jgi:transcriptional regulator with PAS, ATPase and Fis domain
LNEHPWSQQLGVAITVCDAKGIVLEMNDLATKAFQREGGKELVGKSLLDCHPEPSRTKLQDLLQNQRTNIYTIEKNGIKRLIHQSPWFADGKYAGLVELSFEIPVAMPHFVRPGGQDAAQ